MTKLDKKNVNVHKNNLECVSLDEAFKYERALVNVISEIADQKFKSMAAFAKCAWGHVTDSEKSAIYRWTQIKGTKNRPAQRFTIADMFLAAHALNRSLAELIVLAEIQLRQEKIDQAES